LNACGHPDLANCDDGSWHVDDFACSAPAPCPTPPPTPGSHCDESVVRSCGYVNACGTIDLYECGGDWTMWPGACSDSACPPTPRELDPCSDEGHTCRYPDGAGCELDCVCSSGKFDCSQPPCTSH
jgi:hypothetical protein